MILFYLFGGFFIFAVALNLFKRFYSSRFKLYFLWGKKGSGKSSLLIKLMYHYAKRGYVVYTNMTDCLFPQARIIDLKLLGDFIPPPKSFLALDEVGMEYDNRKFKTFRDSTRDFYKLQRHYKVVVAMASQSWDVDLKIKSLVDEFYLVSSFGPVSVARRIVKKIGLLEAGQNQESRPVENLKFASLFSWYFTWLPKWSKFFDSFDAPFKPLVPYDLNPQRFWFDFRRRGRKGGFKGVKIRSWLPKRRKRGSARRIRSYSRFYKTRFKLPKKSRSGS